MKTQFFNNTFKSKTSIVVNMKSVLVSSTSKVLIASAVIFGFSAPSYADVLGLSAGVSSWDQGWAGNIDNADLDAGGNISVSDDKTTGFYVALEVPVPFVPGFKIQSTPLSIDGEVSASFTYESDQVQGGDVVDLQIGQQDIIAYAQVLSNVVSLDLGLALRRFDAEFTIDEGTVSEDASPVVPMLYGAGRVDLPLSGVYVLGELMAVTFQGSSLQDLKLGIGYESDFRIGGEFGYRQNALKIDDVDDFSLDLSVDGIYLALTMRL